MKIIIEHSKTKRAIRGAFNICGNKEDLLEIAKQIQESCKENFAYGWVKIVPEIQDNITNTEPINWD